MSEPSSIWTVSLLFACLVTSCRPGAAEPLGSTDPIAADPPYGFGSAFDGIGPGTSFGTTFRRQVGPDLGPTEPLRQNVRSNVGSSARSAARLPGHEGSRSSRRRR